MRQKPQVIELSESATRRVADLLELHNRYAIRLSVDNRGCSGHSYQMEFADRAEPLDELIETDDGARLVIDANSIFYLIGTKIDWKEERFGSHFTYGNPQVTSLCGCGESFSV